MTDPRSDVVILRESDQLLVVDKPAGMLTIPGRRGTEDRRPCLIHEIARRRPGKIWIVHRLDVEVSGLVLFARSAEAHRLLSGLFERRGVDKGYEAWTEGRSPGRPGARFLWEGLLVRGKRRVWEGDRGKRARTIAVALGEIGWRGLRLLRWDLRPETGRSHQLRCQASTRGFPIAGDALYGSTVDFLPGAIALRAVALDLSGASEKELAFLGVPRRVEAPSGGAVWGSES